jgi:hypothetical protein
MNEKIKLMRLITGEDIIAQVVEDSDKVTLINPMSIFFKRLQTGKALILMSPWVPIEIVSDNTIEMKSSTIISFMKPRDTLLDHYFHTIDKLADIIFDENDLELSSDDGEEGDDGEEDFYDEEDIEEKVKKNLH